MKPKFDAGHVVYVVGAHHALKRGDRVEIVRSYANLGGGAVIYDVKDGQGETHKIAETLLSARPARE